MTRNSVKKCPVCAAAGITHVHPVNDTCEVSSTGISRLNVCFSFSGGLYATR
jgi:hypothetical protein